MAGVDHAYQYSVEVKSRFSLFLDDTFNDEDPDILLSKLQSQRAEKAKKVGAAHHPVASVGKVETVTKIEPKAEPPVQKAVTRTSKSPKSAPPAQTAEVAPAIPIKEQQTETVNANFNRGRGGLRGAPRSFRGTRVTGPRFAPIDAPDSTGDATAPKDPGFEMRGRGRGRPRGMFGRGRGMPFSDNRDFIHAQTTERNFSRPFNKKENSWNSPEEVGNSVPESGDIEQVNGEGHTEQPHNENEETVNEQTEQPAEDEPKSYTLEEYKAMRIAMKPAIVLTNTASRKPNDGKNVFANMVAHRKIEEVHDDEIEEKENEPEEHPSIDIDFLYTDGFGRGARRARGFGNRGRGATGGFRGARPRGDRGGRGRVLLRGDGRGRGFGQTMATEEHAPPPVIYNDQEFPSLK